MKILTSSILLTATLIINGCGGGSNPVSSINNQPLVQNQTPTLAPAPAPVSGFTIPPLDEAVKHDYLDAINVARGNTQHCGSRGDFSAATPVKWNDALYKAAYAHSYDLAYSNTFSHTGSNTQYDITARELSLGQGSSADQRIEHNGYTDWKTWGENIAAGSRRKTAQIVIDAWLDSDGHCANMMNPEFKEVGLALVTKEGSTYENYWTQNFGTRY